MFRQQKVSEMSRGRMNGVWDFSHERKEACWFEQHFDFGQFVSVGKVSIGRRFFGCCVWNSNFAPTLEH